MANVSDWKGFEKLVAEALGGKRRLRTMESFGKMAPDVYFPKKVRKATPRVKRVAVECKKRRAMNIHALFSEAAVKYAMTGKHLILASKVPRKGSLKKERDQLKKKYKKAYNDKFKQALSDFFAENHKAMPIKKQKKLFKRLEKKATNNLKTAVERLTHRHNIAALVTVELSFFKELFASWVKQKSDTIG